MSCVYSYVYLQLSTCAYTYMYICIYICLYATVYMYVSKYTVRVHVSTLRCTNPICVYMISGKWCFAYQHHDFAVKLSPIQTIYPVGYPFLSDSKVADKVCTCLAGESKAPAQFPKLKSRAGWR